MDNNIPGISYITDSLLGPIRAPHSPTSVFIPSPPPLITKQQPKPKPVQEKDESSTIMKKKIDREKKKSEVQVEKEEIQQGKIIVSIFSIN